jgi:hypothetical protein
MLFDAFSYFFILFDAFPCFSAPLSLCPIVPLSHCPLNIS